MNSQTDNLFFLVSVLPTTLIARKRGPVPDGYPVSLPSERDDQGFSAPLIYRAVLKDKGHPKVARVRLWSRGRLSKTDQYEIHIRPEMSDHIFSNY